MANQKAENAKEGNICQIRCPKCQLLPWEYIGKPCDPIGGGGEFTPESLIDQVLSPLYAGQHVGEWFI